MRDEVADAAAARPGSGRAVASPAGLWSHLPMSDRSETRHPPTRLRPCPASRNCVSSDAVNRGARVAALVLAVPAVAAWSRIVDIIAGLPRTEIVERSATYVHATCRTRWLGFVDDLELELRPASGTVAVRSASRVGYSDLGVNRRRIERLRGLLVAEGLVRPG